MLTQSNNLWVCKHREQVRIARKEHEAPQVCNREECSEPRGFHCCCPCACLHRIPFYWTLLHGHRILAAEDCSMQDCSAASLTLTSNATIKNRHRQIGTCLIPFSTMTVGRRWREKPKLMIPWVRTEKSRRCVRGRWRPRRLRMFKP